MLLLNNILGTLFPDWSPFDSVGRLLSDIGLTPVEVSSFEAPFEAFRHQGAGEPLNLPEDIRTSEDWFRLLFVPSGPHTTTDENGNEYLEYMGDYERGGNFRQMTLDDIGKDFLCLIYYRQRILDLFREGGLSPVISDIFKPRTETPPEYANLNNSLIPVEALTDFLTLRGTRFPTDRVGPMVILTDPPSRHLTIAEVPSFSSMLRDSSNLSRFIRSLSVLLQDGGRWEHLCRVSVEDFNLAEDFVRLRDRRTFLSTRNVGLDVAMSREFSLWDINRDERLPSIRQISDGLGIPYPELMRTLLFRDNNAKRDGKRLFRGLEMFREGFSDRLVQVFVRDIERNTPENLLTNESNPRTL